MTEYLTQNIITVAKLLTNTHIIATKLNSYVQKYISNNKFTQA